MRRLISGVVIGIGASGLVVRIMDGSLHLEADLALVHRAG